MTAKTTRIFKEARSLFWPWCAVTVAGALLLVERSHSALMGGGVLWGVHLIEPFSFLGFVLGIPLLATLSLGNEFQHRTLPLLLSQPVDRMEIWGEKMSVTIVAVLSAALVFCYSGWSGLQEDPELWFVGGALIIPLVASAMFWTLFARSTMGGLALNGVNSIIPLIWFTRRDWIPETTTARSVAAFAFLCYAGVMLWLGRRALARFEVTGGMAGDDLLMAGPDVMPGAMAGWLRCRPTGAILNLVRKELRLLRPLWLITSLAVLVWICLAMFALVPERESTKSFAVAVAIISILSGLIAILAGGLSLGEERTSGTHSWHMTLPVSARRQWLIKLVMALLAGSVCAGLLPALVVMARGFISGSPLRFVNPDAVMGWLLVVSLLTLASFWCACAVKGTVKAVLWVFPIMGALFLAGRFGYWVAPKLMGLLVSRFDPFTEFRFTNAVSNMQWYGRYARPAMFATLLLVPTLLFAVVQSYRLFRKQLQDSALFVVRRLLPLAIVAFLSGFSLGAFDAFVGHAKQQMWTLFRETHEAIEKTQAGAAKLDADHPRQLTMEDLAKASPLSERTRRWLGDASITVAPDKPYGGRYCCGGNSGGTTFVPDEAYARYSATIHLPRGSHCTLAFQAAGEYGILGGACE
jgi:ABC-type transport system involved in multi-copper enzyme maturation permease subunit